MLQFKTVQFETAQEKERVFQDWERFLDRLVPAMTTGTVERVFTDRVYKHLTLHCSYIAHYNRHGFIHTYFCDPEDTPNFLQQFDRDKGYLSYEYGADYWLSGDYEDINQGDVRGFRAQEGGYLRRPETYDPRQEAGGD